MPLVVESSIVNHERYSFEYFPTQFFYIKESKVVMLLDSSGNVYRSENEGGDWNRISDVEENQAYSLVQHPFDYNRVFILTLGTKHYKTEDKGETWKSFTTQVQPARGSIILSFHAERSEWILFRGTLCENEGYDCNDETYYTLNGFDESPKLLLKHTDKCVWARSTKYLQESPESEIYCIKYDTSDRLMRKFSDFKLIRSQDYFKNSETVNFNTGKDIYGVVGLATVQEYMVAAVKNVRTFDLEMYVTKDQKNWEIANFPLDTVLKEKQDGYTILESSRYHLVIDVLSSRFINSGSLFISNSDGNYFLNSIDHTNRDSEGHVDFEKVQSFKGTMLVNIVYNWQQIENGTAIGKQIRSKMSFEDGTKSSWEYITPPLKDYGGENFPCDPDLKKSGECSLHLHSVTSFVNYGFVYSSESAAGFLMGVGNVGPYLLPYDQCDTFLSINGGLNWKVVAKGAHMYEFGNMGSLIVMVDDEVPTNYISYSYDYGANWIKYDLGIKIRAKMLTSDPKSESQSFILIGSFLPNENKDNKYHHCTFKIDFKNLHDRKCTANDFEVWIPKKPNGNPDCLMGTTVTYRRRKNDAHCYVGKDELIVDMKTCPCTEEDFECNYNFIRKDSKCVEDREKYIKPKCKNVGDTYLAPAAYRLIPGNECDLENANLEFSIEPTNKTCTKDDVVKEITTTTSHYSFDYYSYFLDSTVVMAKTIVGKIYRSDDDGTNWNLFLDDSIFYMRLHDHKNDRAFFFTSEKLYYTSDRGKNYEEITLPLKPNTIGRPLIDFHPTEPEWLLFLGEECSKNKCHTKVYFSKDNGKSWSEGIETWAEKCIFGKDVDFEEVKDIIFCSAYKDKNYPYGQDFLTGSTEANPLQLISIDLKNNNEKKVLMSEIVEYFVFNEFLAVAKERNGQLILYISLDGENFAEAQFPPDVNVEKQVYTLLQSNTGSVFLDVYRSLAFNAEYGALFKSNGNGTFFSLSLESTNRNSVGNVDFEKVQGMDGIILANIVSNIDEVKSKGKKVISEISFDDGSTWNRLKTRPNCKNDDCYLNLHGRTDANWGATIYSTSNAIGLVLGIGNVGEYLKDFSQSDTYLSRDAGRNWEKIKSGQSLYELGDNGTMIVVIDNESPTNELKFSWNYGKNWENYKFYDKPVRVLNLMTNPKLPSMKFIITGTTASGDGSQYESTIITVDFTNLDKRDCTSNDFELWDPMEGSDNECLLGRKVKYWRRKADRECKIRGVNLNLDPKEEPCKCTKNDFECDANYFREEGECVLRGPDPERPVNCQGEYEGKSGYRKIHKTKCSGGINLEGKKNKPCAGENHEIIKSTKLFDARIKDYFYFEDSSSVIIRTDDNKVWQSKDSGFSWNTIEDFKDDAIVTMVQNAYFKNSAYFITMNNYHFYTNDGGLNFKKMEVPSGPNTLQIPIFDFHPDNKEWLIYTGCQGCDLIYSPDCHTEAYYTKNGGDSKDDWKLIDKYVRICSWARDKKFKVNGNAIFCENYEEKSGSQRTSFKNPRFCYSKDFYNNPKCIIENVVGFASFEEYVVVAQLLPSGQSLKLYISMDGDTFAEAQFPHNLPISHNAFTILQSNTHSISLHVTETSHTFWGNILKSNSNGTYYGLSLEKVNRDEYGFVDFEKMLGIEGIALSNVVSNPQEVMMGSAKKLKSMITFNDGGVWQFLNSPERDSNGNKYDCKQNCNLHLHSYTERRDPRDSFSSSSATGLMMGVGNVGEYLTNYLDGDTFLTRDAGLTWNEIKKGAYMYDFGDQGSILILVDDENPTDHIIYSFNEGLNWVDYQVTEPKNLIKFHDIATSPNGLSSKFILRGRYRGSFDKEVIVFLDFTGKLPKNCTLNTDDPDNDDYELWSPTHANNEKCLFGRETQYYRRNLTKNCQVGDNIIPHKEVTKNCTCTLHDFECDYNYIRNDKNECVLVEGTQPLQVNIAEQCSSQEFYYESNGFRKIPFSSCEGDETEFLGKQHPCPGLGHSTLLWVMIILAPFIIVGIVTACYVYRRRDRFGYAPLGQIRLGDHNSPTSFIFSIPSLFMDMIYSIRVPRSVSRAFSRILPGNNNSGGNRSRYQYSPVATDEPLGVSLEDYENDNEEL
ncbi:hypothetical protein Glove_498g22 [Diversispora epigaea]|uniref:VPS10 domain-containing protein n=1 Tax=Diversispora epigaea TaxID=1348612 RepID=A0A397GJW5_9GLOM|nr:hypothetical protein Glove_498g22 [Diversispora epigaea]